MCVDPTCLCKQRASVLYWRCEWFSLSVYVSSVSASVLALLFQTEFSESSESIECLACWIPYTGVCEFWILATAAFKYVHIIFNTVVVVAVAVAGSSTQAVNITCLHGNLLVTAHIIHNAWLTNTLPQTHTHTHTETEAYTQPAQHTLLSLCVCFRSSTFDRHWNLLWL